MILIAESGSTKCDWLLTDIQGNSRQPYSTMGFNPLFQTAADIAREITANTALASVAPQIHHVFYYGAGVSSKERAGVIKNGLNAVFTNAALHLEHDLAAAAYATYNGTPCISCILGTGSNSCFFDGKTIREKVPALGFILGDEGSGAYFGKQLITAYLYDKLPAPMAQQLREEYTLSPQSIFEAVYQKPRPNVYLAGFSPFIAKHSSQPILANMLHNGFMHFIREHVLCYENATQLPVHFVGSIAHAFQQYLQSAARECGITVGMILQKPLEKLFQYHVQQVFPNLGG